MTAPRNKPEMLKVAEGTSYTLGNVEVSLLLLDDSTHMATIRLSPVGDRFDVAPDARKVILTLVETFLDMEQIAQKESIQ